MARLTRSLFSDKTANIELSLRVSPLIVGFLSRTGKREITDALNGIADKLCLLEDEILLSQGADCGNSHFADFESEDDDIGEPPNEPIPLHSPSKSKTARKAKQPPILEDSPKGGDENWDSI